MLSTLAPSLIEELESAMTSGSMERRTGMMRRVTDLFVSSSDGLTEDQIRLFDDVITHLVDHIEQRALAELSARLAPIPQAPAGIIRRFARDDEIAISGPVLAQSPVLTDADLIEIAGSKSQAHLVQIAVRPQLSPAVTDILVDRGDRMVASEVAANQGARFSNSGFSKLVLMADGDDGLTESVGLRADIPPDLFRQLLAHATDAARQRLLAKARPEARDTIHQVLSQIGAQFGGKGRRQRDLAEAQRLIASFRQDNELVRSRLALFAQGNRMAELAAALSSLSGVRIEIVERLLHAPSAYGTMVMCRAIGLDWPIALVVIRARPGAGRSLSADLDEASEEYPKLSTASAQRLLRFWQVRQKVH
jgi:uncharacterized protein (DUF2336 family)